MIGSKTTYPIAQIDETITFHLGGAPYIEADTALFGSLAPALESRDIRSALVAAKRILAAFDATLDADADPDVDPVRAFRRMLAAVGVARIIIDAVIECTEARR
mgnify:CR=1 FL=1